MCDALEEMRKCYDTHNYSPMRGLVEEVQSMGNRMEAALEYKKETEKYRLETREAAKELVKIKEELKVAKEERDFFKLEIK